MAALALMFSLATAALMVRSVRWADVVSFHAGQRMGYVKSVAGSVTVMWTYVPGAAIHDFTEGRSALYYDDYIRVEAREGWWRREWFTLSRGRPIDYQAFGGAESRYTILVVPHWFLALVSGAVAIWFGRPIWRDRQRGQRHARGRCVACGYDLRATPAGCPECGTPAGAGDATAVPQRPAPSPSSP